jgi:hypothetical protein
MKRCLSFLCGSFLLLASVNVFGLGIDYYTDDLKPGESSLWPKGFVDLVNTTNRVHGFCVNEKDVFFFQGGTNEFNSFLQAYAKIDGIEAHELILHEGIGNARAIGGANLRACDWSLTGRPKGWRKIRDLSASGTNSFEAPGVASEMTGYILTVEFWTGGKIPFDQVKVPANVKVTRDAETK